MSARPTRRSLLAGAGLGAGTLALAACGGGSSSGGGGGGGGTLMLTLSNHPWTDVVKDLLPRFEEESGLKVELTTLGEDQLSDQYKVKLNSGASDIDVAMLRPLQEGKLFSRNGWLLPLDDQVSGASDWNWDDFQAQGAATTDEGIVCVPIVVEQEVMYYRTDLLEAAGLEVPATFDDLEAAAKAIQEANDGVFGFVARGQRAAAVTQFSSFLYGYGGDWDDAAGTATIDTPEARAAYEMYTNLLRSYGPPGTTNMSWKEASAIFQQGQAAFYTDASVFYNNMIDETQSRIGDTFAVAPMPAGDAGSKPYSIPSWALAINAASENTENAWTFIQWATSAEIMTEISKAGVAGSRTSVWDDPDATSAFPENLTATIKASLTEGVDHDRPVVVEVSQARDIVGAPIPIGIEGGDLDAAITTAQTEYQAFLDEEG